MGQRNANVTAKSPFESFFQLRNRLGLGDNVVLQALRDPNVSAPRVLFCQENSKAEVLAALRFCWHTCAEDRQRN